MKLNKELTIVLLILVGYGLFALSRGTDTTINSAPTSDQPQKEITSQNPITHWTSNKTYSFIAEVPNGRECLPEDSICTISIQEYEFACKKSHLSELAAFTAATLGQGDYLYKNGNIDYIKVTWDPNYSLHQCRVVMELSGIINGSSAKRSINVAVNQFIVNSSNEVLVSSVRY